MNVVLKASVEFVWWWGFYSHFHVQPNYNVEVVLCYVVVGVVTVNLSLLKIGIPE